MTTITLQEYIAEVEATAKSSLKTAIDETENYDDAIELLWDEVLNQDMDCHDYNIYNCYPADILRHTLNDEAYEDVGIELSGCFSDIQSTVSYWAFRADVSDKLTDLIDEIKD